MSFDQEYSFVHREIVKLFKGISHDDKLKYEVLINKHDEISSTWMYYCYFNGYNWVAVDKGLMRLKEKDDDQF